MSYPTRRQLTVDEPIPPRRAIAFVLDEATTAQLDAGSWASTGHARPAAPRAEERIRDRLWFRHWPRRPR